MAQRRRHIIAIGGVEPDNSALDRYVLAQARSRNPSICFLATASGDAESDVARFDEAFTTHHRCRPTHVTLFGRPPDLKKSLLTQDVIYVGGATRRACWRCGVSGRFQRCCVERGELEPSSPASAPARSAGSKPGSPTRGRTGSLDYRASACCRGRAVPTMTGNRNGALRSMDSCLEAKSRAHWPLTWGRGAFRRPQARSRRETLGPMLAAIA